VSRRTFALAASLALTIGAAFSLSAQEKPTADQQKLINGTWKLDPARSDAVGASALNSMRGGEGGFARPSGGGGRGGGGGGGGKGKGRQQAPVPDSSAAAAASADAARNQEMEASTLRDPHMAIILSDFAPGAKMIIATNDSTVAIAVAAGQSSYKTDGHKRQDAQMDGSIIETEAGWKDGTLAVAHGVTGVAMLTREFKPNKDGSVLEIKETVEAGGGKLQKKLVFTRE
jgi:hypothetical protein